MTFFTQMTFWHWFGLSIFLGLIDVLVGAQFFLVWCGLCAALVGALLLLLPLSWPHQWLIFGLAALSVFIWWRRRLSPQVHLNQRAQQYLGRVLPLETAIVNARGKVRVDDTLWQVTGEDLAVGTLVRIIKVEGMIFTVERVD